MIDQGNMINTVFQRNTKNLLNSATTVATAFGMKISIVSIFVLQWVISINEGIQTLEQFYAKADLSCGIETCYVITKHDQ